MNLRASIVRPESGAYGAGQCPVKRYNGELRDLIVGARAKPSFIVCHELPLEQAPSGCENFDKHVEGWTRVLLRPAA